MYDYEKIMTFDQPFMMAQPSSSSPQPQGSSSSSSGAKMKKKKSITSDHTVELRGPVEVDGSVKSMATVSFVGGGEFVVRDRIEAYGDVELSGYLSCGYVFFFSFFFPLLYFHLANVMVCAVQGKGQELWQCQDPWQGGLHVSSSVSLPPC